MTAEERLVIFASSLGTVFEWYDFYIYGTLAPILAAQFFAGVNPSAAFIFTLLAFAAGFAVRPFGALFFGRLGDLIGRKYTFLITMTLMGLGTFCIGLLPNYAAWGIAAPITLICLRLFQGLALGGEYGGAAIYVAEHSPKNKRGFYTSWIQTTATVGLFMALLIVLGIRTWMGETEFAGHGSLTDGWRIPFLLSAILLGVSIWIRLKLNESPVFLRMKAEGRGSKRPLTEAFGQWANLKIAILALLGANRRRSRGLVRRPVLRAVLPDPDAQGPGGDGADPDRGGTVDRHAVLHPVRLAVGQDRPQADHPGRLPAGGADLFSDLQGDHPLRQSRAGSGAGLVAGDRHRRSRASVPSSSSSTGTETFTTSCDIAKSALVARSVNYDNEAAPKGTVAQVKVGEQKIPANTPNFAAVLGQAITAHGYPAAADTSKINYPMTVLLLTILVVYVTLVYAPIAAWLVELFPTRIRYSGLSLPYHIGNGWFGGFLPAIVFAIVAATGNIYSGLWYPILVACMSLVVGFFFLPETKDVDITKT